MPRRYLQSLGLRLQSLGAHRCSLYWCRRCHSQACTSAGVCLRPARRGNRKSAACGWKNLCMECCKLRPQPQTDRTIHMAAALSNPLSCRLRVPGRLQSHLAATVSLVLQGTESAIPHMACLLLMGGTRRVSNPKTSSEAIGRGAASIQTSIQMLCSPAPGEAATMTTCSADRALSAVIGMMPVCKDLDAPL